MKVERQGDENVDILASKCRRLTAKVLSMWMFQIEELKVDGQVDVYVDVPQTSAEGRQTR